jgi:hypothetical protein
MRQPVLPFVSCLFLSACGGGTSGSSVCRLEEASGTPSVVQTTATEVWRWPTAGSTPLQVVVDDTAVYWYEDSGAVWRWVKGASAAEQLRPAPEPGVWIRGRLLTDANALYWTEADILEGGFQPTLGAPGRLYRLEKESLDSTVVAELANPYGVAAGIYGSTVYIDGVGTFMRIGLDGGGIDDVSEIPSGALLFEDRFYWLAPGSDTEPQELFRGHLNDPTLFSLGRMEASGLDIGPDHVLWHRERYDAGPPQVLYESFVVIDERRGCTAQMPAIGESISFATAVDESHVYWHSWNKLGSVTRYADGRQSPPLPDYPFYRMQLDSGRIERIETPGFSTPDGSSILGQDATHVFIATPDALVSIEKP